MELSRMNPRGQCCIIKTKSCNRRRLSLNTHEDPSRMPQQLSSKRQRQHMTGTPLVNARFPKPVSPVTLGVSRHGCRTNSFRTSGLEWPGCSGLVVVLRFDVLCTDFRTLNSRVVSRFRVFGSRGLLLRSSMSQEIAEWI